MKRLTWVLNSKSVVTEAELRSRLTKRLRGAVTDREWAFLVDQGHVGDLMTKDAGRLDQGNARRVPACRSGRVIRT
jgi:hypothetical protein